MAPVFFVFNSVFSSKRLKSLKQLGNAEVPQEAFLSILKKQKPEPVNQEKAVPTALFEVPRDKWIRCDTMKG